LYLLLEDFKVHCLSYQHSTLEDYSLYTISLVYLTIINKIQGNPLEVRNFMDALPCLHKVYTAPGYTYAYWDSNNPAQFKVLDLNETNAAAYTISQVPIHLYTNNERILIAC